jgi:branched-chain amino acid transport system permease protein
MTMRSKERVKPYIPWITITAGIIVLPIILRSPYVTSMMVFVALYGVLAIGMGLLMGQAGLFSLTQPTWFGLGAYVAGTLAVKGVLTPWIGIIMGAAFVALISYFIGVSVLRLRGLYLACATFGILVIAQIAFVQLGDITGGHSGLLGIPTLSIGDFVFRTDLHYYFLSWALCIGCLWFSSNVINSRVGRAIKSSRDSEVASKSLGVNIPKYRLQIFVLTSVMAALAGGIFCFYLRLIAPSCFGFALLVELMLMIVIGGIGNLWGLLLGSFVITWLTEFVNMYLGKLLPIMTGEVEAIFFGILVILVLIFLPRGLAGWVEQLFHLGKKGYEHFSRKVSRA